MSADDGFSPAFVDTNILVYAIAGDDPKRSAVAADLLRKVMRSRTLRTSTQVLQELFVTLTRKGAAPMDPKAALRYIDQIAAWPVCVTDFHAVRRAIELSISATLSFWDALIVVAAAGSGAAQLYSEDLPHGHVVLGVRIVNPFRAAGPISRVR